MYWKLLETCVSHLSFFYVLYFVLKLRRSFPWILEPVSVFTIRGGACKVISFVLRSVDVVFIMRVFWKFLAFEYLCKYFFSLSKKDESDEMKTEIAKLRRDVEQLQNRMQVLEENVIVSFRFFSFLFVVVLFCCV